jgi:hypothetical protein
VDATETARICRLIASLIPAQHFDDQTPLIWAAVLEGVRFEDALEGLKALARTHAFISAKDVLDQVAVIRKSRMQAAEEADGLVPNVDPDDTSAFLAERRAILAAAADGTLDIASYEAGGWTLTGAAPRRLAGSQTTVTRELAGRIKTIAEASRLPRADLSDGTERPKAQAPPREVDAAAADAMEAERDRQLAALEAAEPREAS